MSTFHKCIDWKKHFVPSNWWTRMLLSQFLLDLFNWILTWANLAPWWSLAAEWVDWDTGNLRQSLDGVRSTKSHCQSVVSFILIGLKHSFCCCCYFYFSRQRSTLCVYMFGYFFPIFISTYFSLFLHLVYFYERCLRFIFRVKDRQPCHLYV